MLALYSPQSRSFDPTHWWIFEKYDGVRAIWHPVRQQLFSRWGTILQIPNYILDVSPPHLWLDGEVCTCAVNEYANNSQIWFGRERHTRYQALKISSSKVSYSFLYFFFFFDALSTLMRNWRGINTSTWHLTLPTQNLEIKNFGRDTILWLPRSLIVSSHSIFRN